ncbi:hypothetical protein [Albimonas pacifica]|uniref:DUF3299 domain-containing protein n=1 Tax=Albimonas pacifica TaxID=1114924 RepID=A0A1I3GIB0_9RHOB|nr:hypothetical protein [Albimonas pacifica]SFI23173.1 hypothetical protein SAMN05216258_105175 [Albimonas pacifica]
MTPPRPSRPAPARRDLLRGLAAAPLLLRAPAAAASAAEQPIRLRELYEKDLSFSALALSLEGERTTIEGFMAPPLKAESRFFVLTNRPLAVCPFCESEAEWPDDILAVLTRRVVDVIPFNIRIAVEGRLSLGARTDPETGFVSRVRLEDAEVERA